jgi:surface antigen
LIRNGVDAGYLRGNGMAYQWASQAQAHGVPVDGTPAEGAIAWWGAVAGGTSSSGHVAYVEDLGNGYIVVSEDNYGGNFH